MMLKVVLTIVPYPGYGCFLRFGQPEIDLCDLYLSSTLPFPSHSGIGHLLLFLLTFTGATGSL